MLSTSERKCTRKRVTVQHVCHKSASLGGLPFFAHCKMFGLTSLVPVVNQHLSPGLACPEKACVPLPRGHQQPQVVIPAAHQSRGQKTGADLTTKPCQPLYLLMHFPTSACTQCIPVGAHYSIAVDVSVSGYYKHVAAVCAHTP